MGDASCGPKPRCRTCTASRSIRSTRGARRPHRASNPSSPEFALIFRLICTLTIEKVTADTAIMLDWRGREAATGGRTGQCAIAAARLCRRIEACSSRSEVEIYPGFDHGFAFSRCATYHQASEHRWARLRGLFNRALAPP